MIYRHVRVGYAKEYKSRNLPEWARRIVKLRKRLRLSQGRMAMGESQFLTAPAERGLLLTVYSGDGFETYIVLR